MVQVIKVGGKILIGAVLIFTGGRVLSRAL